LFRNSRSELGEDVVVAVAIVGAEVAFWVVLGLGLLARYVLRRPGLSRVLLLGVPLVDLALLVLVGLDLAGGTEPGRPHALAGLYLGLTVAFGHPLVRWADARFAHRFRGTPLPPKPAKGTREHVRSLWVEWARVVAAAAIAVVVLALLGVVAGTGAFPSSVDAATTNPLWAQMAVLPVVVVVWFLAGPAFARTGRS
jgi:hypothetical protein